MIAAIAFVLTTIDFGKEKIQVSICLCSGIDVIVSIIPPMLGLKIQVLFEISQLSFCAFVSCVSWFPPLVNIMLGAIRSPMSIPRLPL